MFDYLAKWLRESGKTAKWGAGCGSFSPDTEMSRGRAPPAPKIFGAHREGPAVASAILESGGPGDRSVLLFRILPKPGCWHRQVIVSTGFSAPSRKTCRSFHSSAERRVGKMCFRKCRSWVSPIH